MVTRYTLVLKDRGVKKISNEKYCAKWLSKEFNAYLQVSTFYMANNRVLPNMFLYISFGISISRRQQITLKKSIGRRSCIIE